MGFSINTTNQIRMKIYCNQHAWYLKSVKCLVQTVWIQTEWIKTLWIQNEQIQTEWVETKTIKEQKRTSSDLGKLE